jgi:hypothetical protein
MGRENPSNTIHRLQKKVIKSYFSTISYQYKKLPFQQCYKIMKESLDKCNSLEKLDNSGSFHSRISYSLKTAEN